MLILFETAAGFALFKVLNEGKLKEVDNIYQEFENPQKAQKIVALKQFSKFENTTDALASATALVESKLSKGLKKFLKKNIVDESLKDTLAVADTKLGSVIKEKLGIKCVHDNAVDELLRGIRLQLTELVSGMSQTDVNTMALGLSHSLSRYKLKFSPDKVDTMIVQAISLLDDLDKELNIYAMRAREWYGWHFPEMGRVIPDNILYAKTVKTMGIRTNATKTDFSAFLEEEMVHELQEAAQISMGTEVSDEDIDHVKDLCEQVISISEYREQLYDYLKNRMQAIAPNTTVMVGELVGARLIAHAGSLMNLAKFPASTIQILGAEKALFRSLKTKHNTPKYGLIYHASIVGQATPKNKGKISRVLAAKTALSVRVDALAESEGVSIAVPARERVENRLRQLEGGAVMKTAGSAKKPGFNAEKYDHTRSPSTPGSLRQPAGYNAGADQTLPPAKKQKVEKEEKKKDKKKEESSDDSSSEEEKKEKKKDKKKDKKDKKEKKVKAESSDSEEEKPKKKEKKDKKDKKEKVKEESSSEEEKKEKKKDKKKDKKDKKEKKEKKAESSDSEEEKPKKEKKEKKEKKDKKDKKEKKKRAAEEESNNGSEKKKKKSST